MLWAASGSSRMPTDRSEESDANATTRRAKRRRVELFMGSQGGDADRRHTAARTLRAQRTAAMAMSTPLIEASVIDASVPSVFQSVTLTRSLAPATTSLMTTSSIANVDSQSFGLQST